jgi:F-type H+-transporting ATPase subunit c
MFTELLALLPLAEAAAETVQQTGAREYLGFGLAIGLGLAALGGALGQSRAVAGATEAVSRQPEAAGKIQGLMIIGLALIETLVIYMLLICFLWGPKLDQIS